MLRLAAPAVLVQVGLMLMGVVDTIMAGRISAEAIAGAALGNLYFFILTVCGLGTLLALDPLVAQAVGARDELAVRRALQRGVVIAALLAVVISLALLPAASVFVLFRQPAEIIPLAAGFARASIAGVLPFLLFVVCRQTLQAHGRMTPVLVAVAIANVANAALNWVLIYGNLGVPAYGAVGSAWSSSICRWLMLALVLVAGRAELAHRLRPIDARVLELRPLLRMLRVGLPIGLHQLFEVGAFAIVTLLAGLFGTVALAGHEIALNLASLTFMVPLGVGSAAAVLVGRAVGERDADAARWHAASALVVGVAFMVLTAGLFLLGPGMLARLYTRDASVVAITAVLLPIAGIFQVFDGAQAVSSGILRGAGETRAPMLANLVGFWLVGVPLSALLAFRLDAGPAGLWWGLVAGLATVAAGLLLLVRRRLRTLPQRLQIDDVPPAEGGAGGPS